jgi:hypothetical protein
LLIILIETEILVSIISYLIISYKDLVKLLNSKKSLSKNENILKEFYLKNLIEVAKLSNQREIIQLKCQRQLRHLSNILIRRLTYIATTAY